MSAGPAIIKRGNAFCFNIESNLDKRSDGGRRLIAAITRPRFAAERLDVQLLRAIDRDSALRI